MAVMFAVSHLSGSVLSALGLQLRSMLASVIVSCITLLFTWCLAGNPALRLHGVVMAQFAGQLLSILSALLVLWLWRRKRH